jgi:ribosomal protein L13
MRNKKYYTENSEKSLFYTDFTDMLVANPCVSVPKGIFSMLPHNNLARESIGPPKFCGG